MSAPVRTGSGVLAVVQIVAVQFVGMPFAALLGVAAPARAQQVRGEVTTAARFWQVRPLVRDTVAPDRLDLGVGGRFELDGQAVDCGADGVCTRLIQGERADALGVTQDVALTAWGAGVRGLSATALLRARWDAAGDISLPRTDDPFDAILAYAEYARGSTRVRVGRQRTLGGLGSSGYDGAEVRADPVPWADASAYFGRALARGLEEPREEILAGVEDYAPRTSAWLAGGTVGFRPAASAAVRLRYQREVLRDRSGLLSERAALNVRFRAPGGIGITAAADYDFGFGRWGKASLSASAGLPAQAMRLQLTARRYVPYFELWTIWGLFSPVAFHEGEVAGAWTPRAALSLSTSVAYRRYEDADAPVIFDPLERDALRWAATADWHPSDAWSLRGAYAWENGAGAFRSSGNARVGWRPAARLELGVRAAADQQIREFRVGVGRLWSLGGDVAWGIGRTTWTGGLDAYRHSFRNRPGAFDWTQLRGWSALSVALGEEPEPIAPTLPPGLLPGGAP